MCLAVGWCPWGRGSILPPAVDTALRLAAFAAEEPVATLCAAAATGHTGPDVLSRRLLCKLGLATHRMILEYRTLFRAAWTGMEARGLSAAHDADAEARLTAVPEPAADGPGGPWRHALLVDGCAVEVSVHAGLSAAAASVAAQRGVDERSIRWAEPVAAAPRAALSPAVAVPKQRTRGPGQHRGHQWVSRTKSPGFAATRQTHVASNPELTSHASIPSHRGTVHRNVTPVGRDVTHARFKGHEQHPLPRRPPPPPPQAKLIRRWHRAG